MDLNEIVLGEMECDRRLEVFELLLNALVKRATPRQCIRIDLDPSG